MAVCCARAASGHAAKLDTTVMNSRRLMGHLAGDVGGRQEVSVDCYATPFVMQTLA